MKNLRGLLAVILVLLLPLVNTACLDVLTGLGLADADYSFVIDLKAFIFCYLLDAGGVWPTAATIALAGNLRALSSFRAGLVYGAANLYYDPVSKDSLPFSLSPDAVLRRAVNIVPRFSFPVIGASTTTLCVDYGSNGRCDPGEPTLTYNAAANQVQLANPVQGLFLRPGIYAIVLYPPTYQIQSGLDDFSGDISATITGGGQSVRRNFFFLRNAQVLPYVAFGNLGALGTLTTQIAVNNPHGETVQGRLQFFRQDGTPLDVTLGGTTSSRHAFNIAARSSLLLEIDPFMAATPQVGWGFGYGSDQLEFSLVFGTYANAVPGKWDGGGEALIRGDLRREVGIAALSRLSNEHVLVVNRTASGNDTAFAVVNPTGNPAVMSLSLKEGATERASRSLTLAPRSQTARFVNEFFGTSFTTLSGTLVLTSDTQVGVLALKTFNGEQSASLPSGFR